MRAKTVAIVSTLLMLLGGDLPAASNAEIDKTRWFDCLNKEDCLNLAATLQLASKGEDFDRVNMTAASLSTLLGAYLRPNGEPLNLGEVFSVRELEKSGRGSSKVVDGMISVVLNRNDEALNGELSSDEGVSAKIIKVLALAGRRNDFLREAGKLLSSGKSIPFLAVRVSRELLNIGECAAARKYLKKIVSRYEADAEVVSLWARSEMDCGNYPDKVASALKKGIKKNPGNNLLLAQKIRFDRTRKRSLDVNNLLSEIDINAVDGAGGASLLSEFAKYFFEKGDLEKAERLALRALPLDPDSAELNFLLGKIYFSGKKDLTKAVSFFKYYVFLVPESSDAAQIKLLILELETELR